MDHYEAAAAELERVLGELAKEEQRMEEEQWKAQYDLQRRREAAKQAYRDALPDTLFVLTSKDSSHVPLGVYTRLDLAQEHERNDIRAKHIIVARTRDPVFLHNGAVMRINAAPPPPRV
jgi:hypothetical protein